MDLSTGGDIPTIRESHHPPFARPHRHGSIYEAISRVKRVEDLNKGRDVGSNASRAWHEQGVDDMTTHRRATSMLRTSLPTSRLVEVFYPLHSRDGFVNRNRAE